MVSTVGRTKVETMAGDGDLLVREVTATSRSKRIKRVVRAIGISFARTSASRGAKRNLKLPEPAKPDRRHQLVNPEEW